MTTALTSRDVCRDITAKDLADLLRPAETRLAAEDLADTFRPWHAFVLGGAFAIVGVVVWMKYVQPRFLWNVLVG